MRLILPSLLVTILFSVPAFSQDTVYMRDNDFVPQQLSVDKGDQVVWVQDGNNSHNTISGDNCSSNGLWKSKLFSQKGKTFTYTFDSVGTFPYFCRPHCAVNMVGTITVQTTTGVATKDAAPTLKFYPNPVEKIVNIQTSFAKTEQLRLRMVNLQGQVLLRKAYENVATNQTLNFRVGDLKPGSYFLKIENSNGQVARQMVIKK
jgi:plastocyanin